MEENVEEAGKDAIFLWVGALFTNSLRELRKEAERIAELYARTTLQGRKKLSRIMLDISPKFIDLVLPLREKINELALEGDENSKITIEQMERYMHSPKDFIDYT